MQMRSIQSRPKQRLFEPGLTATGRYMCKSYWMFNTFEKYHRDTAYAHWCDSKFSKVNTFWLWSTPKIWSREAKRFCVRIHVNYVATAILGMAVRRVEKYSEQGDGHRSTKQTWDKPSDERDTPCSDVANYRRQSRHVRFAKKQCSFNLTYWLKSTHEQEIGTHEK